MVAFEQKSGSTAIEINEQKLNAVLFAALQPGLEQIGAKETAAIKQAISVPVGRDARGNVTVRSKRGEPPRLETGELQSEIQYAVLTVNGAPLLEIGSARPSTPRVPDILEMELNRPYMAPALMRMAAYALKMLATAASAVLK